MGAEAWFLVQPHSMLPTARNGSMVMAVADAVAELSVAVVTLTSLRGTSASSSLAADERGGVMSPLLSLFLVLLLLMLFIWSASALHGSCGLHCGLIGPIVLIKTSL